MFSQNALKVLEKRYFMRDEQGTVIEGPEQLFKRVATAVAQAEQKRASSCADETTEKFYQAMLNQEFMPNSPTLMNAGKPNGQLSACFVLPVPDSLEGIFETCKNAALIHKTGGGTGFSFSQLRPANDRVASSVGVASGPVSFMAVYDAATEAIRQGGTRRGANMGMLRVDHPDIEGFIACKRDTSRLNNFNISVAATDAFMNAVEADTEYDLIHPRSKEPVKKIRAREIFEKLVDNAHATGEPGLIFIDRINHSDPIRNAFDENGNLIPGTEDIEATNPCGEQPLGPGDACNLGSINVAKFVRANDFDWERLADAVKTGVRFLDDVVDVNHYPLPFISHATLNNRRIGLGIMGWAESLIRMGIPYNTEEAVAKAEKLMSFIQKEAHEASQALAAERGAFPNWSFSSWSDKNMPMRNATVTTIAPTGTISIIAGTSSGIEPLFAISFIRRVMGGTELVDINPLFEEVARERGFYSEELMARIAHEGTLAHLEEIPDDVKRVWVCSHDISYEWHVRMQVAFQKHVDNAVSKTINFPKEATLEDVRNAYLAAWQQGLKGITVYRDASRSSQVLNIGKSDPLKNVVVTPIKKAQSASRSGTAISPQIAHDQNFHKPKRRSKRAGDNLVELARREFQPKVDYIYNNPCPECSSSSGVSTKYESCSMCVSCGYTKC
ncbi:MAG TPA: adenosylcobalamin-dependent ribonucleoside-diphosphate reductase [Drouetiella sp.]